MSSSSSIVKPISRGGTLLASGYRVPFAHAQAVMRQASESRSATEPPFDGAFNPFACPDARRRLCHRSLPFRGYCIWSSMSENACFNVKAFLISTALT